MQNLHTEHGLRSALHRLQRISGMTIKDIMQTNVVTLNDDDLLATAARTLIENHINGVIIMKNGRPWSILTSYDLLHQSYLESFSDKMDYLRTPLKELIEQPVLETLTPEDDLAEAARLVSEKKVRTIPVCEKEKLVGVISIFDLVDVYHHLILEELPGSQQ